MFNDFTISPYPGLRSFSEEESLFFRGRDTHIHEIINLLQSNKFLMVTGASGDGKSSIIFSGLVPNARAGFFKSKYTHWEVAHFRPERSPVKNLAKELAGIFNSPQETLQTELNRGFGSLVDLYKESDLHKDESSEQWKNTDEEAHKKIERSTANLLVIVDQFEEFFTNPENYRNGVPTEEAQVLINLLLETAQISLKEDLPIYVVFTMRSDYIGQCAAFRGLPEFIGFSQFFVPRLKRKELKQIIEEPAELNGNSIAPRLVERILYDLSEGIDQLPILQHALSQVWLMADKGKEQMDLIHYAKVGGMLPSELPPEEEPLFQTWFNELEDWKKQNYKNPGLHRILDIHADELYEGAWDYYTNQPNEIPLSKQDCKLIIAMSFACLTKIDHSRAVRNRMTLQEITNILNHPRFTTQVVGSVINIYREQGNTFVRPFIDEELPESSSLNPDSVLDITHESLIRNWERLSTWADQEFEYYEIFLDFEKQLEKWIESNRNSGYLLPIGPLTFFEKWQEDCRPNKYWINRYNQSSEDKSENLEISQNILKNSHQFLKKSSRKVIISKAFIKYGTLKLATGFAIILVMMLSAFYYYDAEQKVNSNVLREITKKAKPLLTSSEVGNGSKGFYILNLERVFEGGMFKELNAINDLEQQVQVALNAYKFAIVLDRNFDAPEKYKLVDFIEKTLIENELSSERTLFFVNSFIDLLGYDYYLNNTMPIGASLQTQTNKLPELIEDIIKQGKIEQILTLNQAIENYLNWNNEPQEGINYILSAISPFNSKSYPVFKLFYPQEGGLLNGRRGNISHNGGYQIMAYLFASQGDLSLVKQSTDSLLLYNKNNYFDVMTFNNATNILGYFAQFEKTEEMEEYLNYLSSKSGLSRSRLMNLTLDHAGGMKSLYAQIKIFEEENYNPGLSILYQTSLETLFNLYEKVIKEDEVGDNKQFHLAMLYKQRGAYLSWQAQLPSNNINLSTINGWFDKALERYVSVSNSYKSTSEEINYRYWGDGIRNQSFSKAYFFMYPDYFYNQWQSGRYVSTAFMNYILDNELMHKIYKTSDDLETINDWLSNYNEVYPNLNESRALAPFDPDLIERILDEIAQHPAGDNVDKTLLLLLAANHSFKNGNIDAAIGKFKAIEVDKIGPLANRWQYLNYTFIYNQLLLLSKSLAINGYHQEAKSLIESTPDANYKTFIYGELANFLSTNRGEIASFVYLDSALQNNAIRGNNTMNFFVHPSYPIISTLAGIGGVEMISKAKSMFIEMQPGLKGAGLFRYIRGIAWSGNYHRAVEAIPINGSSQSELNYYTLILTEEANKMSTKKGWDKIGENWNFITRDYIVFRNQN